MPRRQKTYHYIYRTTCLVTGRFYVGMHSTDIIEDGYLGSGKILGYSLAKHGKENHKRDIIEMCSSREALKLREREIVNEKLLADPLNINLKYGGEGGWELINETGKNIRNDFLRDDAYRLRMSISRTGKKPVLSEGAKRKQSDENPMKRPEVAAKLAASLTGTKQTEEHKARIAARIKEWHRERKQRGHDVKVT